ncbi:5-hydroxytryptamine receptor 2B-like, partial [Aphis craccivora]
MHLCTISVDRYLSLRYPMKFGRNKTRRRVILKIVFVWLLSIAMSLPLSLMYSKDFNSVLVNGSCQIPDPLYKLIGSIVSFYIPLGVMILTYTLTVRHLAAKRQNLQTGFTHNSNQIKLNLNKLFSYYLSNCIMEKRRILSIDNRNNTLVLTTLTRDDH